MSRLDDLPEHADFSAATRDLLVRCRACLAESTATAAAAHAAAAECRQLCDDLRPDRPAGPER